MEIQLQELIEQIKNEGVAAAEAQAKAIVDEAKAQAEKILADAKAEAEQLMAQARQENDRVIKSGEDAIRQAGRNLLISFRESVARELKAVTGDAVAAAYAPELLGKTVADVVAHWAQKPDAEDITVVLNSADLEKLEGSLLAALKDKLGKGVTLLANDNFDGGFRIAVNDSGAYYDYSAAAVVDMLSNYLSPKVTALLKEAE